MNHVRSHTEIMKEFREGVCSSETKLQNLVMRHLRPLEEQGGFRVLHIANGGKRSKKSGAMMKHMGVRKGFPDLMILRTKYIERGDYYEGVGHIDFSHEYGEAIFIELKQPDDSKPDPEQAEWHTWLVNMLFPVYVCTSLQSVLTVLRGHDLEV